MSSSDPSRTALIMIGYQKDYFDNQGILNSVIEESTRVTGTLSNTESLLERVKDTDMTIISTPIVFSDSYQELENPVGILKLIKDLEAFKSGTSGAETIDMIRAFGDRIMEIPGKTGFDAFSNTDLPKILKDRGIDRVAIAGAVTSICVNATAMRAFDQGFEVVILSDCTSGRTVVEQEFFCQELFPLFAEVIDHGKFVEGLGLSK